jgi:hypothetical protein
MVSVVRYGVQCQPAYDVFCHTKQGPELTAGILEILNLLKEDEYIFIC